MQNHKSERFPRWFTEAVWYIMLLSVIGSAVFAGMRCSDIVCRSVHISIDGGPDNLAFIDEEKVKEAIRGYRNPDSLTGISLKDINARTVEERLLQSHFVAAANVFVDLGGSMTIAIRQKKPILRLIPDEGIGYYLDEYAKPIPLNDDYTARVAVVTGRLPKLSHAGDSSAKALYADLISLYGHIGSSALWSNQFTQIHRDGKGEYWLIPTVGSHKVLLGDSRNLDDKFGNLLVFYRKGISKTGWGKYKVINSKYTGQIVCEKW